MIQVSGRRVGVLVLVVAASCAATASAALIRIPAGPGSAFPTLAAALDHAATRPDDDLELALRSATYAERIDEDRLRTGDLVISGGWNSTWTARTGGPESTVLTPLTQPAPSSFDVGSSGENMVVRFENLTFAGSGQVSDSMHLFCNTPVRLELRHVVVRNFTVTTGPDDELFGGGLSIQSDSACRGVGIEDSSFHENVLSAHAAGGAGLAYIGPAPLSIERSTFRDNVVMGSVVSLGGGLYAAADDGITLTDVSFLRNRVAGDFPVGSGLRLTTLGNMLLERLDIDLNVGSDQLNIVNADTLTIRNSIVSRGSDDGVTVETVANRADLNGVTIVDNAGAGTSLGSFSAASVSNSILYGNESAFGGEPPPDVLASLVEVDPKFVNRDAGDYRLLASSPAIDAGDASPPGGLGDFDVRGAARVSGGKPDIGAYEVGPSDCRGDGDTLCLTDGRFAVDVGWRVSPDERGVGTAVPLTDDSGQFWFFNAPNVEMLVKVLDGCDINQRFWVFAGGLTNVEVTLAVEDTATGKINRYVNPINTPYVALQETGAFASCGEAYDPSGAVVVPPPPPYVPSASAGCTPNGTTLCLTGSRFQVRATWHAPDGTSGTAGVVPLSADTGALWFFDPSNVEMLVKLLDGCSLNAKYWAFFTGLTNVEVDLEILDTLTGTVYPYHNPPQTAFPPVQNTSAFEGCPGV